MIVILGPVGVGFREKDGVSSEVLEFFYRWYVVLMKQSLGAGQTTAILRYDAECGWEFMIGSGVNFYGTD